MHYSREPTNQSSHSYIFYMNVNITTPTCRVSAASVWRTTSLRSGTRGCHCDLSPPTGRSCSPLQPQLPGCRVLPESPVSSCNRTENRDSNTGWNPTPTPDTLSAPQEGWERADCLSTNTHASTTQNIHRWTEEWQWNMHIYIHVSFFCIYTYI